ILYLKYGVGTVDPDPHADLATGRRVLQRVGEQVGEDLLEPHAVDVGPGRRSLDAEAMLLRLARRGEGGHGPPGELGQVEGLALQENLAGHHAPHVEQV